jgi:hypothetical protein
MVTGRWRRAKVACMGLRAPKICTPGILAASLCLCTVGTPGAHAAEQVTLRNGFDFLCDHRTTVGDKTRLFLIQQGTPDSANFVEVPTADITAVEAVSLPVEAATPTSQAPPVMPANKDDTLTPAELHELLATAGSAHNLDVDLLDIVVHAESGGRAHAVSRTGAQGLMQLMPGTAAELGVTDSFAPSQNINGGTSYLNALLVRYNDRLALALAAYNAGPKAVDRYHGVPPYPETRAYVARIIHQFNQRKLEQARKSERAAVGEGHALTTAK